jgi:hypothetical protein
MGIMRRWLARGTAGLGVGVVALTGCQTYPAGASGMTLPSPHYLEHYPQYFPPDPPYPLQRELDSMLGPDLLRPVPGLPAPVPLPAPGGAQPLGEARPPVPIPGPAPAPAPAPAGVPMGK